MNLFVQSVCISLLSVALYSIFKQSDVQEHKNSHKNHMYIGGIIFIVSLILLSVTNTSEVIVSTSSSTTRPSHKPPF